MNHCDEIDGNCENSEYIDGKHICKLYAGDNTDRNICNSTNDNGVPDKYRCKNYSISRDKFRV